ncbi:flavodoxin [Enterococcus sp. LJL128]
MTAVIIFFSRAGENFVKGKKQYILVGHTEVVARKISAKLKIPAYPLLPVTPYPKDYEEVVQLAAEEKQQSLRICYEKLPVNFKDVTHVFLGFPNWWGSFPRVVGTFLEDMNWENKIIFPFCTHEGSAFGSSMQDLEKACAGAEIKTGLPIRGSRTELSDTAIKNWLLSF